VFGRRQDSMVGWRCGLGAFPLFSRNLSVVVVIRPVGVWKTGVDKSQGFGTAAFVKLRTIKNLARGWRKRSAGDSRRCAGTSLGRFGACRATLLGREGQVVHGLCTSVLSVAHGVKRKPQTRVIDLAAGSDEPAARVP
jgi:hypothetical protein